jgi:hypothetical protein
MNREQIAGRRLLAGACLSRGYGVREAGERGVYARGRDGTGAA